MIKNLMDSIGKDITEYKKSVIATDIMNGVRYSFRKSEFRSSATIIKTLRKAPPMLSSPMIIPPIIDSVSGTMKYPSLS